MTVTVVATDLIDAACQLGLSRRKSAITIEWRHGDLHRWEDIIRGCIVDGTNVGEETKRVFHSAPEALRYIAVLLNAHDERAREQDETRANEKRLAAALAKKKCECKK